MESKLYVGNLSYNTSEDELRTRDTASPFPGSDPRYARPPR